MFKYIQPCLPLVSSAHLRPQYTLTAIFFFFFFINMRVAINILWTSIPLKITQIFMVIFILSRQKKCNFILKKSEKYFEGHDITFWSSTHVIKLNYFPVTELNSMRMILLFNYVISSIFTSKMIQFTHSTRFCSMFFFCIQCRKSIENTAPVSWIFCYSCGDLIQSNKALQYSMDFSSSVN